MQITVNTSELQALVKRLEDAGKATKPNLKKMFQKIGVIVKGVAIAYAPRSMTKREYESTLKGRGKGRQTGTGVKIEIVNGRVVLGGTKKERGTGKGGKLKSSRKDFTSGQLKKSIQMESSSEMVSIFVPSNAPANKYAEKIHDEKGKTWRKLGWQNDAKATDKYIYKAQADSEKQYMKAVDAYVDQLIKGI